MHRKFSALAISLIAFGLIAASAATLGDANSEDVGADSSIVASCDSNGISADYRFRWDTGQDRYEIRRVVIRGMDDDCIGQRIRVTLAQGGTQVTRTAIVRAVGPVDNRRRGWGLGNSNIDAGQDFSLAVVISD